MKIPPHLHILEVNLGAVASRSHLTIGEAIEGPRLGGADKVDRLDLALVAFKGWQIAVTGVKG